MEVVVHQLDGVTTLRALPLAAGLLVASARKDARVLREVSFSIRTARLDPDEQVASYQHPDVLAFSTYVWNERVSREVARLARRRFPAAFVVLGGPSVPRRPERAAAFLREHPFVDALVLGEGELAFRDLLRALLDQRPLDDVPGLVLRAPLRPEGALLTAPRGRIEDFGSAGSPYLDGTFDQLIADGARPGAAILETNRGCPFACTFCDWGQAIASRVHERPTGTLHGELEWIARQQLPYLYIVDANYGSRKRDVETIREIGRLKASHGFPQYVFFHLTKNATERHLDVVFALRDAGIGTHLALSAQDFEPRVLLAVKRDNVRLDRALEIRRICHERGIPTFNELILGLPGQTYDSFADSMVKALTPYPGDAFQLYLARLLENAEMASPGQRALHGLETRQVLIASFHHDAGGPVPELEEIVVATSAMPAADWKRSFKLGFFLAAACNLKLLDVVFQVARRAAGADVRALLEGLLSKLAAAPAGSAPGRIDAALERHAEAILRGETMVLPAEGTGEHLWPVEDTVVIEALSDKDAFYSELAAAVGDPLLAEAVRFQAFVTPAPLEREPRLARFEHDFPEFLAGTRAGPESLARRPTGLSWTPGPAVSAAPDRKSFFVAYLNAAHARVRTGALLRDGQE